MLTQGEPFINVITILLFKLSMRKRGVVPDKMNLGWGLKSCMSKKFPK
jgi:hypothetical protein